jgi:hypothetical protein
MRVGEAFVICSVVGITKQFYAAIHCCYSTGTGTTHAGSLVFFHTKRVFAKRKRWGLAKATISWIFSVALLGGRLQRIKREFLTIF